MLPPGASFVSQTCLVKYFDCLSCLLIIILRNFQIIIIFKVILLSGCAFTTESSRDQRNRLGPRSSDCGSVTSLMILSLILSSGRTFAAESFRDPRDCPWPWPSDRGSVTSPAGRATCTVGQILHGWTVLQAGLGYLHRQIWVRSLLSGKGTRCFGCALPKTRQVCRGYNHVFAIIIKLSSTKSFIT